MRSLLLVCTFVLGFLSSILLPSSATANYQQGMKDDGAVRWTHGSPTWPPWLIRATPEAACQAYADGVGGLGSRRILSVVSLDRNTSECEVETISNGDIAFENVGLFCWNGTSWQPGAESCEYADDELAQCQVPDPMNDAVAGNPIVMSHGVKIQQGLDWSSPKDNRFRFERSYRSDVIMGTSPVIESYGMSWGSLWDVQISPQGTDELIVHRANAARYLFSGSGQMVPYRSGHKFELLSSDPTEGNRRRLTDGSGRQEYYLNSGEPNSKLDEIRWPDGYTVTVLRDSGGKITQILDTLGQMAQFTWDDTLNTNYVVDVVTKIEIDANYDGISFVPEVSLNYTFEVIPYFKNQLLLSGVSRTDLLTSISEQIWTYEYSDNTGLGSPAKLTGVGDGRLNALGQAYNYAEFSYGFRSPAHEVHNLSQAIRSEHFGGADAVDVLRGAGSDVTQTNALGKVTITDFAYVAGRKLPISVVGVPTPSCLGTAKSIGYTPGAGEPEGYIYERIERNGSRTVYTRNPRGLVITKTEDADGLSPRVTSYTWDTDLRLPLTRTTSKMTETFVYSPEGILEQYSQTDVQAGSPDLGKIRTWDYIYTTLASGLKVLTTTDGPGLAADGVNDVTVNTYDANGNLTKVTDPNGLETIFTQLNSAGQPTLILGPNGIEWGFAYDIQGRIISSTQDPSGAARTSTYNYDVIGQLTSYTNTLGKTWTFEFDEARRLVKSTDPIGAEIIYVHDLMGNITHTEYSDGTNAASFFEDMAYDELGRILSTTGAEAQAWNFTHDVEDNLDVVTDPLLHTTDNTFDALNRLVSVLNQASRTTDMEYNDSGQMTQYTDQRSISTYFGYNGFGELVAEISPDRGTIYYAHNNRGLVNAMLDGNGILSIYVYDDAGRLLAHSFPTSPTEDQTFEYDLVLDGGNNTNGIGKIGRVYDESGWIQTRYGNDEMVNESLRVIEGVVYNIQYNYNLDGQLLWVEYPSVRRVNYSYNDTGNVRLVQTRMHIIDPGTGNYPPKERVVHHVKFEPFGPLRRMVYGDDYIHRNFYDQSYRLTRIHDFLSGVELRDADYTWTLRDNVSTITDTLDSSQSLQFDYNRREYLTDAAGPWGTLEYLYNAVGSRVKLINTAPDLTVTTDDYRYGPVRNRLNKIIEPGGFERTFTYDSAGNVTYDNRTGGGYGYTYNAAGRMDSFSINGVVQAEYVYNALGQQVVRRLTQTGQTIHSIHDLDGNRIAEYDFDAVAGTSTLIREYIWLNGQPIAVIEGGVTYYIRTDHIGRPVFATDDLGAKVWEATYLPFGGVFASSGANIDLRFPGQWFQSESGLHQNWMRDYDPTTGRYIQADPLGLVDGASVYGYALQNPMRYTDPKGERSIATHGGGGLGGLGTAISIMNGNQGLGTGGGLFGGGNTLESTGDDAKDDARVDAGGVCEPDDDDRCYNEYLARRAICRQLTKPSLKRSCYAQATEILAACQTGRPEPYFPYPM